MRHFRGSAHLRAAVLLLMTAGSLLAATGCGGSSSSSDQAKTNACNAKSDINTQVQKLKGLPPTLSSVDTAQTALKKIGDDLKTIQDNAPDVKGDLKGQLQDANAKFKDQVQQIGSSITSPQSLSDAATALTQAGTQLSSAYQQAFANVSC